MSNRKIPIVLDLAVAENDEPVIEEAMSIF